MIRTFFACIVCSTLFTACSTDLEVNAPYKDIQVTYSILNQQDTAHYIKINKAFLGEADAMEMAKYQDSSEYAEGALEVTMVESGHPNYSEGRTWSTNDSVMKIERVLVTNKEPGEFYAPNQHVYRFLTDTSKAGKLHENATYTLTIRNKNTDSVNTAVTELVNDFNVEQPGSFTKQVSLATTGGKTNDYELKWSSGEDARRYNIKMVFNYSELNKATNITTRHAVEFNFNNIKTKGTAGSEQMIYKISADQFYSTIESNVPELNPAETERFIDSVDFYFYVAGEELNTYMEVNEPSTGIIQEKPVYTNFTNGIGIFSSRYVKSVTGNFLMKSTATLLQNGVFDKRIRFTHYLVNNQGVLAYNPF